MSDRETELLKTKFEAILKDVKDTNNIYPWKSVFDFIVTCENYIDRKQIKFIAKYTLEKLLELGCGDSQIITRIIKVYSCCRNLSLEEQDEDDLHHVERNTVKSILAAFKLQCIYRCNSVECYGDDENLLQSIDEGNLVYTIVLVKYGILLNRRTSGYFPRALKSLIYCRLYVMPELFHKHTNYASCERVAKAFLEKLMKERGKLITTQRGIHRIYLLVRIFVVIFLKRVAINYSNNYFQGLRIYFSTITDPFVAKDEINEFLQCLFIEEQTNKEVARELTEIYAELFHPESTLPYAPRSLKHLSRCAARTVFQEMATPKDQKSSALPLPNLIKAENIPQPVKELLLGAPELRY